MIASLIETCKLNGVEPHGYLTGVLSAIINGHKQMDIEQLLPWNYAAYVGSKQRLRSSAKANTNLPSFILALLTAF